MRMAHFTWSAAKEFRSPNVRLTCAGKRAQGRNNGMAKRGALKITDEGRRALDTACT